MSESAHPDSTTESWKAKGGAAPFDSYRLLGIIGQGGMGTVYKAYHLTLKRFVAIKVLRIDRVADPDLANRFVREMQAVGQMDHPNVVRAADAGKRNGVFYLIMEYLDGADLSRLVTERGPLPAADACELARQAAVGLDYIHQTLVHRDVKPSNLILTPSGVVKILDLGLARLHEVGDWEGTPTGLALGTYDYQAPEQAVASSRVDGRADVYSLGCTLFKLLTGRPPFPGPEFDSAARKLHAHGTLPLTAAPDFPLVPEALRPVLLRMTAKDPAERYASAREVAEALAPFAAGSQPARLLGSAGGPVAPTMQPLPSRPPDEIARLTVSSRETASSGAAIRPAPTPRRRRLAVIGAALLLASLLAALTWVSVPALREWLAGPRPAAPGADAEPNPSGSRALDSLEPDTYHPLLDQAPVVIGGDPGNSRKWRYDKGRQAVEGYGYDLLFLLGTTSRSRFTLEAGVTQAPWTGNVGLFWGYHEDAEARSAKTPSRQFAWFQMVKINQWVGDKGEYRYSVERGQGALLYDAFGEVRVSTHISHQHDLPALTGGEKILLISVAPQRLSRALLGPIDLNTLYSDPANSIYESEPYQGGLGLITLGNGATFGNVRFIARSGD